MTETTTEKKVKTDPIDNTELVEEFRKEGGNIFHVREDEQHRGVTFAYKVKGRRIEIATALTHTAIDHFHNGNTIFLPYHDRHRATLVFDNLVALLS